LSAQGIIHLLAAHAPTIGIELITIAANVTRTNPGANRSRNGVGFFFATPRDASHAGDSGNATNTNTPNNAGAPENWKIHRHESGVIGHARATCDSNKIPVFNPADITPDTNGFDAPGQHSATSAIPFGHIPPTPNPTRNRSTSICSTVCAHPPIAAKIE
jgi:hypothetical protein